LKSQLELKENVRIGSPIQRLRYFNADLLKTDSKSIEIKQMLRTDDSKMSGIRFRINQSPDDIRSLYPLLLDNDKQGMILGLRALSWILRDEIIPMTIMLEGVRKVLMEVRLASVLKTKEERKIHFQYFYRDHKLHRWHYYPDYTDGHRYLVRRESGETRLFESYFEQKILLVEWAAQGMSHEWGEKSKQEIADTLIDFHKQSLLPIEARVLDLDADYLTPKWEPNWYFKLEKKIFYELDNAHTRGYIQLPKDILEICARVFWGE